MIARERSEATERYLQTIFELEEDRVVPRRARISSRLGHSKSAVSQKIERMRESGLVQITEDRRIVLTPSGNRLAVTRVRRHRLAERMLADMIGIPRIDVHEIACGWQQAMVDDVERRLVPLLGYPATDPWGNPIPGLSMLGFSDVPAVIGTPISELPLHTPTRCVIRRFSEYLQSNVDALAALLDNGIEPGVEIKATIGKSAVVLANSRASATVPPAIACSVHVEVTGTYGAV
ncbi:iron-dependent regulator IdeR [Gordonia polyisoprenivorans NBRC 16320 = JCM 10675]|uniref:Metal-dependent transcriptional regulator n=1 Tax=Gordonia polyisoprenivorans TaxID=84595 RepID=A0A846WJF6_9ACTN|nr:metal-dependent transcriptional regulator [Gordonia polyisoprenivorans]NKY01835.1 metal-dependent transcriptional regulator [Gordonia polyisoprenivorans]WCB36909.1 metal-dependent transcriptional regulator [Gordonia polyisoprenivorans]GAB25100.1 iron-dependent regulator IdeR [Gordonia polyisoprenivorans NBRC 16320 = JCM 10675]